MLAEFFLISFPLTTIYMELCNYQTVFNLFVEQRISAIITIYPVGYTIIIDDFIPANSDDLAHNEPALQTTDYSSA